SLSCSSYLRRLHSFPTRRSSDLFDTPAYREGDAFLFGRETRGLPGAVLDALPPEQRLRLPMRPDNRSLNLSNAVAVVVFEAWRRSEEHTSELQSRENLVCRLLLE